MDAPNNTAKLEISCVNCGAEITGFSFDFTNGVSFTEPCGCITEQPYGKTEAADAE